MARRTLACARALLVLCLWSLAVVAPAGGAAAQLRPGDILYFEPTSRLIGITPGGDPTGFSVGVTGGQFSSVSDVATGPGGAIYVSLDHRSPRYTDLLRVDPVSEAVSLVTTIPRLGESRGLAVERAGTVLMLHNNEVLRIDPTTGGHTVVSSGGLLPPPTLGLRDVEVGPDGTVYVGLGSSTDDIVRIDPVTGAQSLLVTGNQPAGNFTVAPDGNLYYPRRFLDNGQVTRNQIVRVDTETGAMTLLYDAPSTAADPWYVVDLVVDPAGDILGTDVGQPIARLSDGRIVKFDRETGERSLVYGNVPGLENPQFIAIFVPEPGAAGVCVAVGGVLLMRRRRGAGDGPLCAGEK